MLQADAAQPRAERQEEFVAVEGTGGEEPVGLGDQAPVRLDLRRGGLQLFGRVGENVEGDRSRAPVEHHAPVVTSGEDGGIDQGLDGYGTVARRLSFT